MGGEFRWLYQAEELPKEKRNPEMATLRMGKPNRNGQAATLTPEQLDALAEALGPSARARCSPSAATPLLASLKP